MKASIIFDGRLHLEAAKALEYLQGKVLSVCLSWQKIRCQQLFHSSLTYTAPVYSAIRKQVDSVLESFIDNDNGVEYKLEEVANGSWRVDLFANATKTVVELRRPLEKLMRGRTINHESLTQSVLRHLFSPPGINLMRSIQQQTQTYVLFDKRNFNVRVFGSSSNTAATKKKLIQSLLTYHES
ncbi:unnamed protein product [Linum trigynum]|uniref:Uncharacterized protein n=1 Tax=Linum trigynum TaxID=586398 RepID=A0AAV2ENF1_9ROSI